MWTNVYCGPAPTPPQILNQWNLDPWLLFAMASLALAHAVVSARAPSGASRTGPATVAWMLLVVLFVSPLCALTSALFSARVAHHAVMVAVIAPLLVLGWPQRTQARDVNGWAAMALLAALHAATLWLWHAPSAYAAALSSTTMYWVMELSLLGTALLLWHALLAPGTSLPAIIATLIATVAQMGLLGALITFARAPLYAAHLTSTSPWGMTALEDQQLAGLIMWIPAALPYIVAGLALVFLRLRTASLIPRSL